MTGSKARKTTGGINLSGAFASAGASIVQTAGASMPAYAQHVADTAEIAPNPLNAREIDRNSPDIQRLAASLKSDGQLQAIPVVPRAEFLAWEGFAKYGQQIGSARFVVIGGGRRLTAAQVAGLLRMDISIKSGLTREAFLRMTVIENIEREELTPLEEARQIQILRDASGDSYAELGKQLNGRTKGWVAQRLDLLKLSPQLQDELASEAAGSMTTTQARTLLKMIRAEAGEQDDASVSADRQWELWEQLRDGSEAADRLPRKRAEHSASDHPPTEPAAESAPVARTPKAQGAASTAVPAQGRGKTPADQGAVVVRADAPPAMIVQSLRERMSPEQWREFAAAVERTLTTG